MFRTSILAMTLLALAALTPVHAAIQTVTFNRTISFDGVTVTVSGSFTVDTTARTLDGTASVKVVDSMGQTILTKTFSISLSFGTSNDIKFVLDVPTVPLMLGVSCDVDVSAGSASCTVSGTPDANHDGTINILDLATVGLAFGSTRSSTNFSPNADLNADSVVNILDLVIVAVNFQAPVFR